MGARSNDSSRLAEVRGVLLATGAYLVAAAVATIFRGNAEFAFYLVTMLVLVAVVAAIDRVIRFSHGLLWALSLWGLLHMAGGLVPIPDGWPREGLPVLYSLWLIPERLKYDHVVHAYGFAVTTLACWEGLRAAFRRRGVEVRPTFGLLVLCAVGGMGFGALNEVIEFAATLTVPETNVGGYVNTGWDLVANLVGATLAATGIHLRSRGRTRA